MAALVKREALIHAAGAKHGYLFPLHHVDHLGVQPEDPFSILSVLNPARCFNSEKPTNRRRSSSSGLKQILALLSAWQLGKLLKDSVFELPFSHLMLVLSRRVIMRMR